MKTSEKRKLGKKSRAQGMAFELKVRHSLEKDGWNVAKFSNNVDLELNKMIPCKHKFNFFTKAMTIGTGFPDFIIWNLNTRKIIGVESKLNGTLDKVEKLKCSWLLKNNIFDEIRIAKKIKVGRCVEIEYKTFKEEETK